MAVTVLSKLGLPRRFTGEILQCLGAPRSPGGTWLLRDAHGPAAKELELDPYTGDPVYRSNCAWRAALVRSLRENRTISGSRNLELASTRANGTKLNRVVVFRGYTHRHSHVNEERAGSVRVPHAPRCTASSCRPRHGVRGRFVPDSPGEARDRLYYVADGRVEKAEQALRDVDAEMIWRFKMTRETYIITGRMLTIRSRPAIRMTQGSFTDALTVGEGRTGRIMARSGMAS